MPVTKEAEFWLKDFEKIHDFRKSFAEMRMAALGATLTILGLVASLGKSTDLPSAVAHCSILLLIVFTGIRIIAALNRGMVVFAEHLRWLEERIGVVGLASYWGSFVSANVHNSGSYAFIIAARALNVVVTIYSIFQAISLAVPTTPADIWLLSGVGLGSATMLVWNELTIRRELDPRGFSPRVAAAMKDARDEALKRFASFQQASPPPTNTSVTQQGP